MSEIYVYNPKCEDFTTFGLVGALEPTSCVFEEEANGMSEIALEHPLDSYGKYKALEFNNILVIPVPVRTTPEIEDEVIIDGAVSNAAQFVTNVWKCKVLPATPTFRCLYIKRTGAAKIRVLPAGHELTVVKKYDEGRWKVRSEYGTGWVHQSALSEEYAVQLDNTATAIESVEPAWTVKPQLFRIYEVRKNIASVSVAARHITYDLLYNTTTFKSDDSVKCRDALKNIFDVKNLYGTTDKIDAFTNLDNEYAGIDWTRINPINALLDPETGLVALYNANLVRDNWEMYFLDDPGKDRGVRVEYARNMTGIEYIENTDEIVTRIIPVGETKDGKPLLYEPVLPPGTSGNTAGIHWVDSDRTVVSDGEVVPIVQAYPVIYTMVLECKDCKVGSAGIATIAQARQRMQAQAIELFKKDIDLPKIEMSVDFINLGDTEEYRQFRNLERLFLFDYVTVRHKQHGIDVKAKIVNIKWDCLLDRMERMEIGSSIKTLADTQTFSSGGQFVARALPATGGTVDGSLYLKSDPIDPLEAATKQYVDKQIDDIEVAGGVGIANITIQEV